MARAYYNENEHYAAEWLRCLIANGFLPEGDVDERDIRSIRFDEIQGYTQYHFFAGIGGWPYAARLAGWPDERPLWTGSCPCQPFSAAGKRKGTDDPRHLWPEFKRLIGERRPAIVFGEQVASKDGRLWLAGVRADLETLGYAVGGADLCAAGVGAPHIRQRLFWVADANGGLARDRDLQRSRQHGQQPQDGSAGERLGISEGIGERRQLGGSACAAGSCERALAGQRNGFEPGRAGADGRVANGDRAGLPASERAGVRGTWRESEGRTTEQLRQPWRGALFIRCSDGKARRIEPGIFPLAHGVPNRVGMLRGAGNAVVPKVAAEFIAAYLDVEREGLAA